MQKLRSFLVQIVEFEMLSSMSSYGFHKNFREIFFVNFRCGNTTSLQHVNHKCSVPSAAKPQLGPIGHSTAAAKAAKKRVPKRYSGRNILIGVENDAEADDMSRRRRAQARQKIEIRNTMNAICEERLFSCVDRIFMDKLFEPPGL